MRHELQTTLCKDSSIIEGIGIHTGLPVKLQFRRAQANTGIVFRRTGPTRAPREVKASYKGVISTGYATVLGDSNGALVSTTEHAMAAVRGMGVDNVIIEVNGPEVPIMDGSAKEFVTAIRKAGIRSQHAGRRYIKVLKPVHVRIENIYGKLTPHAQGFRVRLDIDFPQTSIGKQSHTVNVTPHNFSRTISNARTFGFIHDLDTLRKAGYARGATYENSIVFDETRVLNKEGLRYENECARHKVLDIIGDFAMADLPILGSYESIRGGHKINHAVICALMKRKDAWKIVKRPVLHY